MKRKRVYILYDGRARTEGTDDAEILATCESDAEARSCRGDFGDMACYSYRIRKATAADVTECPGLKVGEDIADDERWEWDYHESE